MKTNVISFISKSLLSIIITLIILIIIKANPSFKDSFYKYTYGNNFSFYKFNEIYKKYIGDSSFLNNVEPSDTVFSEKLSYNNLIEYNDGVMLEVDSNYVVPVEKSGIVVFIGNKENYNNTVIIQRIDGVDEWYGNIDKVNVKLYDYVKEGTPIGEAEKKLYLVYKKDGKVLDYKEYLK